MLFLTLRIFSTTGGVEKVNRIAGSALNELALESNSKLGIYSMYDHTSDINEKYFPANVFLGFNARKFKFVYKSIFTGIKSDVVILSHVNLLFIGYLIKIFSPKTKLLLLAHGIEVWKVFPWWKIYMLRKYDQILAVSKFTRDSMIEKNKLSYEQFTILNNCLDPFLPEPMNGAKDKTLLMRYGLHENNIVLLTLTRLSSTEKHKGYDVVLKSVKELIKEYPTIKYVIVGKYDEEEKQRINKMVSELGLFDVVVLTGFVQDKELAAHYQLADVFVMPSKKEGFGIVFIEALYYGVPVIAGNKDGSVDALYDGAFGLLTDPDNQTEIIKAIKQVIDDKEKYLPNKNLLNTVFSYSAYKNNIRSVLKRVA